MPPFNPVAGAVTTSGNKTQCWGYDPMPSVPRPPCRSSGKRNQLLGYVDDTVAMCRTENLVTRPGAGGSREPADEEIIDGEICQMIPS